MFRVCIQNLFLSVEIPPVSVTPVTVWEEEVSIGRSVGSRCERALVRKDVMDEEAWSRGSSQAGGAAATNGRQRRGKRSRI